MITHICTVCNGQLLQRAPYEQKEEKNGLPSLAQINYSVNDKEKVMMNIIACFGLSNQQSRFVPCDRSLNPLNALWQIKLNRIFHLNASQLDLMF